MKKSCRNCSYQKNAVNQMPCKACAFAAAMYDRPYSQWKRYRNFTGKDLFNILSLVLFTLSLILYFITGTVDWLLWAILVYLISDSTLPPKERR